MWVSMKKIKVGLVEKVKVIGRKTVETSAKFDTGAKRTCIDFEIAAKARLGPIVKTVKVKSGTTGEKPFIKRVVVPANLSVCGKNIRILAAIEDRQHSKQKVLIGRDIIHSNFIIDVARG